MRAGVLIFIGGLCLCACNRTPSVSQPIDYSHKAHVEKGLACEVCHQSVETAAAATLPTNETCMMCHQGAITDSPEEEKVRQYAERGEQIPWQRVYVAPDHVFFSHRRHVKVGQVACEECHGAMAKLASALTYPLVDQNMDWCLGCHQERGATTDCIHCHR